MRNERASLLQVFVEFELMGGVSKQAKALRFPVEVEIG